MTWEWCIVCVVGIVTFGVTLVSVVEMGARR